MFKIIPFLLKKINSSLFLVGKIDLHTKIEAEAKKYLDATPREKIFRHIGLYEAIGEKNKVEEKWPSKPRFRYSPAKECYKYFDEIRVPSSTFLYPPEMEAERELFAKFKDMISFQGDILD